MKKFLLKNYFSIINYILFVLFGLGALYLIDSENSGRNPRFNTNIYREIITFFGKKPFNVQFKCYLMVGILIVVLTILFIIYRLLVYFLSKKMPALFFFISYAVLSLLTITIFTLSNPSIRPGILCFSVFGLSTLAMFNFGIYVLGYIIKVLGVKKTVPEKEPIEKSRMTFDPKLLTQKEEKKEVFPALLKMDEDFKKMDDRITSTPHLSLEMIATDFNDYLNQNGLYFDLKTIRFFLSGFSISRLIILEGLSGTGKTTLPRMFMEYLGSNSFILPIQPTYRDRSDLLGYYSDLSNTYKETDFLKTLYRASYTPSKINIMVLDEMNLSRIEYYFADFLSVLEGPSSSWKMSLIQVGREAVLPNHLEDGILTIPENTWFIGTANKDDSTFLITDKVYDRAMVIDFKRKNTISPSKKKSLGLKVSATDFVALFEQARTDGSMIWTEHDRLNFSSICDFMEENFGIVFGNRIMNQITKIVPCYVAMGGSKEEIIDLMFASKVLRKMESRYEGTVESGLNKLKALVNEKYKNFPETNQMIDSLLKKFQ